MRLLKTIILILALIFNTFLLTGCWNYKEIDKLAIVAGLAVDKGENSKYKLTIEIPKISGSRETKMTSKVVVTEGDTMFEAVRSAIAITGKRLYWSHTKVLIISKDLAREGILQILDWFARDAETRADVIVFISEENSAGELLTGKVTTEDIVSFELNESIANQNSLPEFPNVDLWDFANKLKVEGVSGVIPSVKLDYKTKEKTTYVSGTAVFKGDKLLCFLDPDETMYMLYIQDKIKDGFLVLPDELKAPASLEISRNKTKIKFDIEGENIKVIIKTETDTILDEIGGNAYYFSKEGVKEMQQEAEKLIKRNMEKLIKKMQDEYDTDIFGFGEGLWKNKPKEWEKVKDNWDNIYKTLQVSVVTKVNIINTYKLAKPLELGD